MDYGMIAKREKAKRYAEERNRFLFNSFDLTFHGDNNNHHVSFDNGTYNCDCEFFVTHLRCAHTMAIEILFQGMIPEFIGAEGGGIAGKAVSINSTQNRPARSTSAHQHQRETEIQRINQDPAEKPVDSPKSEISSEDPKTINKQTQKFSIESDLSPDILQEALAPYLDALSDLQHIIDELREKEPSSIRILGISTYD